LTDKRAADNTGLAKVAVQCSADTFVDNQTFVPSSPGFKLKIVKTVATDVSSVAKKLRVYDPQSMLKLVY
jgi:hypothetical protein